MKTIPSRGLQEIRTMSERTGDADNPQRKYLTLAMLELEKSRHNKEKQNSHRRVTSINQRLAGITAEQNKLLAAAEAGMETSARGDQRRKPADSDSPSESGFSLAY